MVYLEKSTDSKGNVRTRVATKAKKREERKDKTAQ
jgi:hypothetical protein